LRTGNIMAPWPEEANRVLTSRLASLHFAPTKRARDNLLAEGVPASSVHLTEIRSSTRSCTPPVVNFPSPRSGENWARWRISQAITRCVLSHGPSTRRALARDLTRSAGDRFSCRSTPGGAFRLSVHLNPNVANRCRGFLKAKNRPNTHLLEPLSYTAFVYLMNRSHLILTDSGGVQEELRAWEARVGDAGNHRAAGGDCGRIEFTGWHE